MFRAKSLNSFFIQVKRRGALLLKRRRIYLLISSRYLLAALKIITCNPQVMEQIAEDRRATVPSIAMLTMGYSAGTLLQAVVYHLPPLRGIIFNIGCLVLYSSAAWFWGGWGGMTRFLRVFGLAALLNLFLIPFLLIGGEIVVAAMVAYQLWTFVVYSFIFTMVLRFSLGEGFLTVVVVSLLIFILMILIEGDPQMIS